MGARLSHTPVVDRAINELYRADEATQLKPKIDEILTEIKQKHNIFFLSRPAECVDFGRQVANMFSQSIHRAGEAFRHQQSFKE